MSGDSAMPDFDDLLAAFDILDVTVRIREATADDEPSASNPADDNGGAANDGVTAEKDDSSTNNDSGNGETKDAPNNSSEEKTNDKQDTANANGEDGGVTITNSYNGGETADKTNQEESSAAETNSIVIPVSVSKAPPVKISVPKDQKSAQVKISLPKELIQQKMEASNTSKPKIVLWSPTTMAPVRSPTLMTSVPVFKNTSGDGPKILNVTGGVSNLIRIPSSVSGGKQVVLQQIVSKGASGGTMKFVNSNMLPQALKPSVVGVQGSNNAGKMPLYRLATTSGGKASTVQVTVSSIDVVDMQIKNLSTKQLSRKNPIDTYIMTPPPADLGIDIPIGGYRCKECGDSYALEDSLVRHMTRKSVKILINCSFCRTKREFYNKCSMHAHIRGHKLTNMNTTIDAVVSPLDSISTTKAGRPKVNANVMICNEDQKSSGSNVKDLLQQARKNLTDKLKIPSSSGLQDKPASNQRLDMSDPSKCPLCSEQLDKGVVVKTLRSHLQTRKKEDQGHACQHCGLMAVNFCQLMLHNRIHFQSDKDGPWLCPECGEKFTNLKPFLHHINRTCLHFCRTAIFNCNMCSRTNFTAHSYGMHLSSVHKKAFYKCLKCHLAFRSIEAVRVHSKNEHNYTGNTICTVISKCPICETVFTWNSMLEKHMQEHIRSYPPLDFRFTCMMCSFKSVDYKNLKHHMKVHSDVDGTPGWSQWWFCDICRHKFRSLKDVMAHRVMQHVKYFTPQQGTIDKGGVVFVGNMTNGKVEEKNVNEEEEQKESTKVIIRRMLRCPGCKALGTDLYFKKEKKLRNHIRNQHSHMDPNTINPEFVEYVPFYPGKGISRETDPHESGGSDVKVGHKRKRSFESSASMERIKRLREEKMSCGKCEFESKDRIAFSSHVLEHRDDQDVSQCQECGVCFRVEDSLHKHLFIKHQIRDVRAYHKFQKEVREALEKRNAEKKMEMSELEKTSTPSPENPLECSICHKEFVTEAIKKNHMRSHGMAFIRAKNKAT